MSNKFWYYQIIVSEGCAGYANDDEYKSDKFDTFEKCFISYVNFNPSNHWINLRWIQNENFIYVNDDIENVNTAKEGLIYYDNPEINLGITDSDFDKIINKIKKNKKQNRKRK
jgi:hypothetical protein